MTRRPHISEYLIPAALVALIVAATLGVVAIVARWPL